ncbi:MAG: PaaI family thioesterase [Gammaproteobacteria bacterium]
MSTPPDGRGRGDADDCFVCGRHNPIGLRVAYAMDGEICRGRFTPGEHHGGFDRITHGGIVFSVLDDVMANWLFLQGARAFTAKCEIRYRQPLPIGTEIVLSCRLKQRKGRLMQLEASAERVDDGSTVATTEASFMVDDFGRLPPA